VWGTTVVETVAQRVRSSSALAPVIVLNLLNLTPFMLALHLSGGVTWGIAPFLVLPAVAVYQLLYFTHRDPDRLQNERHIERKIALSNRIGFRVDGESMETIVSLGGEVINNPQLGQMPPQEGA